jgi:uncharacterized membrane protein YphA (DoxX/SURF4 family)
MESEIQEAPVPRSWSLAQRIGFRFAFAYFFLYALPENGRVSILGLIPGLASAYTKLWHAICPWIAIHMFHLSGQRTTYFPTGSGDTTLAYIENLVYVILALAGMLVWSILDRKRMEYRTLHSWLRLWLRYSLAFTLFGYGFAKIFPLQFQPPRFSKLIQPYGEFSPMGVLWNFMGSSIAYTMFAGAAEALGGLLLLFRRTTTLGALVSFGVMANVVALNFCYDVPVKLYSTNLLIMAAFLAAGDAKRLINVFLLNRSTSPVSLEPPRFQRVWMHRATVAFWVLFVGFELCSQIIGGWSGYKQTYLSARPALYGLYEVATFDHISNQSPWQKIEFQPTYVSIRREDNSVVGYGVDYLEKESKVVLNKLDTLVWSRPEPSRLTLKGNVDGHPISMELRQIDPSKFRLISRGFHWINEFPFNR